MDLNDLSNISCYYDDDDDLFENVFEIDHGFTEPDCIEDDDDGDKEDDKENRGRSAKAKKSQFKKIEDFMKEHRGASIDKKQFKKLWDKLACELNSLGPPTFTESQWRFKWSQHKYNKKRKLSAKAAETAEPSQEEKQSQSDLSSDPVQKIACQCDVSATVNNISEISDQLKVVIQKEDAILEALNRGNNLLQEIVQSLNKRNC